MKTQAILINGAPGVGKDLLAEEIIDYCFYAAQLAKHCKFANPLKLAVHQMLGLIYPGTTQPLPADTYELIKDNPHPDFFWFTPRQLYIKYSEEFAKKTFGTGFYGSLALKNIEEGFLHIFSDCGFAEEVKTVINHLKPENCLLLEIHREGYTFKNDSRAYVAEELLRLYPDLCFVKLENKNKEDFLEMGVSVVKNWLYSN